MFTWAKLEIKSERTNFSHEKCSENAELSTFLCTFANEILYRVMKFKIGPTGGHISPRIEGVKVELAGRTAFLPNMEVPVVIQRLTAAQIKAIPQDRFAVSLVDTGPRQTAPASKADSK